MDWVTGTGSTGGIHRGMVHFGLKQNEEEEGMKERLQQDVLGIVEATLITLPKCGGHRLWQCHGSAEKFTYKSVIISIISFSQQ